MIHADETRMPGTFGLDQQPAAETVPPGGGTRSGGQKCLCAPGESVADSYIIHSYLSEQGKQSDVYLAKKWGKSYIVKLYGNGWHPSAKMQEFLIHVRHPNIAGVIECGEHQGQYFEIYDYYAEGTLEKTKGLSVSHIQNVIVPSVNEGLHELHRNGIVHCDIKPSNLFYANQQTQVVIGDCGISGYINANGKLVDAVRGTPEYAPRVKSLLWSASMSPAYDYGSFGLVLCRLVLGRSLFAGMSVEEIAVAWENGWELPAQIEGRLASLIKGLVAEDEEQRWGYIQVKRWCEGEFVRGKSRNIYARRKQEKVNKPLIFGRFDGQIRSVNTLQELSEAVREHWEQAANIIKRRELPEFVRQFRPEAEEKVRGLAFLQDSDAAVFRLLNLIEEDSGDLFYCGIHYGSLQNYIACLATGKDPVAERFLSSGLLIYYLRERKFEQAQVDQLEQLIKRNGCRDMAAISAICFAIQGRKTIEVFGEAVDSLNRLISVMASHSVEEIADLLEQDFFRAWMIRMGFEEEMKNLQTFS